MLRVRKHGFELAAYQPSRKLQTGKVGRACELLLGRQGDLQQREQSGWGGTRKDWHLQSDQAGLHFEMKLLREARKVVR